MLGSLVFALVGSACQSRPEIVTQECPQSAVERVVQEIAKRFPPEQISGDSCIREDVGYHFDCTRESRSEVMVTAFQTSACRLDSGLAFDTTRFTLDAQGRVVSTETFP